MELLVAGKSDSILPRWNRLSRHLSLGRSSESLSTRAIRSRREIWWWRSRIDTLFTPRKYEESLDEGGHREPCTYDPSIYNMILYSPHACVCCDSAFKVSVSAASACFNSTSSSREIAMNLGEEVISQPLIRCFQCSICCSAEKAGYSLCSTVGTESGHRLKVFC